MRFTLTETDGECPITEWLAARLKPYIQEKSGLHVRIEIISDVQQEHADSSDKGDAANDPR